MAVAELCLYGNTKWLETEYCLDVGYAGCVKSDQWGIKWGRESLPTQPVQECQGEAGIADPSKRESVSFWAEYVSKWLAWNHVRTVASFLAAAAFSIGLPTR